MSDQQSTNAVETILPDGRGIYESDFLQSPPAVSIDRADVLQVAGELLGEKRDTRVDAMHKAGLVIRAMQRRIDELVTAQAVLDSEGASKITRLDFSHDHEGYEGIGQRPDGRFCFWSEVVAKISSLETEIARLIAERHDARALDHHNQLRKEG